MKNNYKLSFILFIIAGICFAIAAYGNFYNGKVVLGYLSSLSTVLVIYAAITSYKKHKDSK